MFVKKESPDALAGATGAENSNKQNNTEANSPLLPKPEKNTAWLLAGSIPAREGGNV